MLAGWKELSGRDKVVCEVIDQYGIIGSKGQMTGRYKIDNK